MGKTGPVPITKAKKDCVHSGKKHYICSPFTGCPCSLKDRITDSGSVGPGSIPSGGTKIGRLMRPIFVQSVFDTRGGRPPRTPPPLLTHKPTSPYGSYPRSTSLALGHAFTNADGIGRTHQTAEVAAYAASGIEPGLASLRIEVQGLVAAVGAGAGGAGSLPPGGPGGRAPSQVLSAARSGP